MLQIDCSSLESINVSSSNKYYNSEEGVLFDKNKSCLITYPAGKQQKEYEIPATVEEIGKECFRGSNLKEVILNQGVKRICEYAFYYSEQNI